MSLLMLIRKNFYGISGIILLDRYYDLCTFVFLMLPTFILKCVYYLILFQNICLL